ncbi:MAG TPA: hypothetical protein VJT75_10875 [Thermoleophilaceae bacterium]|nr:hypothetical protein [Thermoleophilaceae bacterium]
MPETDVPTVSEIVRRAVALVDSGGADPIARELELVYEDDDRAAPGLDLREELRTTVEGLDPDRTSGAAAVAAGVALFLSTQPGGAADREATIREGVRVMYGGDVPEHVRAWLADQGIDD